ncbi:MAG: glycosyltransferase family 39 protein, partial [Candidatus Omnitrophica bacterium]|nr:glycosyltransferase family 39 protein [Candidatus Omnitrophota bacterium]
MKNKSYFVYFLIVLALIGIALLFSRLGGVGLFEPDEGRSADIARAMVESGDFLIPRVNYIEHFHKPPLTYWAIAASLKVFGFNEAAVRFPSACAALGLVLITFLVAKNLFDRKTALVAGLILLSSPLFLFMGRLATPDIFFAFFTAGSLYGFVRVRGGLGNPLLWSIFGFFFLALAVLTKGPIGILIVFLSLLGWAYF